MTMWAKKAFIEYLNTVDDLLETVYGITAYDTNMELIATCHQANETPEGCVNLLAEKYALAAIAV